MPNQDLTYLFNRYFDKTATPKEREAFMQLLARLETSEPLYSLLEKAYEQNDDELMFDQSARERMLHQILGNSIVESPRKSVEIKLYKNWLKYAAAVLIVLFGVGAYLVWQAKEKENLFTKTEGPVVPGTDKAVLTLANGKKIVLDKGNNAILADGNIEIRKDASGQLVYQVKGTSSANNLFNAIATPKGGQYKVILPDGSQVWLNAATTLKYPLNFDNKTERKVELTGEAYFEVAKNKHKPFKVLSQGQEVTVLGTHFNVNAYTDEAEIKTTLLEGAVSIANLNAANKEHIRLKPNQQAVLTKQGVNVVEVDAAATAMWKNGKFTFVDEPVAIMMRKIARWYNVEIVYANNVGDKQFTGTLSRYENIEMLLKTIESTNTLHFKIEGRRVVIMN